MKQHQLWLAIPMVLVSMGCANLTIPSRTGAMGVIGKANTVMRSGDGLIVTANCWSRRGDRPCAPANVTIEQDEQASKTTLKLEFITINGN